MRQQEIFKKIGGIINELSEQYEYLQADDNHLNELELELFVANVNFLTDHVEILYKLNLQAPQRLLESKNAKPEEKFFEPVVQHVTYDITAEEAPEVEEPVLVHHEEPTAEAEAQPEAKEPEPVEPIEEQAVVEHEPVKEEGHTFDWGHENHTEAVAEEQAPDHSYTPAAAAEAKYEPENEVLTINDRIAEKIEPVAEPRLSDLKQGITLNDKLLFVKDLFNGYNLAYSEAIEILNRYSNFEEATKFLKTNYVVKNNWDSKPATTEKFYALLKRRYS
jgi:hypothetical protein